MFKRVESDIGTIFANVGFPPRRSSRPFFEKGSLGLILRVVCLVQPATKSYKRHQGSVSWSREPLSTHSII
jgi:hypothetical protein